MGNPFTIAVCHQKGGVGKTTTTAGLGSALAERGHRVLLVDLDPAANLTGGLGVQVEHVHKPLAAVLLARDPINEIILRTSQHRLDILPSRPDSSSGNRAFYLRLQQDNVLRNYFALHRNDLAHYDYVLLDCPPTLGPMAVAALSTVQLALIPVQCEYYSLQSLDAVFAAIKATRADTNPHLRYRLLVTMFDRRGTLHARMMERLKQQLTSAILDTTIGFDSKLRESQVYGAPILVYAPKTRAAEQFRALAAEISSYLNLPVGPLPPARAAGSLLTNPGKSDG